MEIFISWASESAASRELAHFLRDWLPMVLQNIEVFISSDIPKGERSLEELDQKLDSAGMGIICLTKESMENGWIIYEVGALKRNKVCVILIGLTPSDVNSPLNQFQHTILQKEDIRRLVHTINKESKKFGEKPISHELLDKIFERFCQDLLDKINEINTLIVQSSQSINSTSADSQENNSITTRIPHVTFRIFQRDHVKIPEVRFGIMYTENGFPIQARIAIEMFKDTESLGFPNTPNGLYNGKTWWNLNPLEGINGHFEIPLEAVESDSVIEVRINVRIRCSNNQEINLLPIGYVYMRDSNSWFPEPGESLHISSVPYVFRGWDLLDT